MSKAERKEAEAILAESPKWARLRPEDKALAIEKLVICREAERAAPQRGVKGTFESYADPERAGFSFSNLKTCYYQLYRKKGPFGLIPYEEILNEPFARPEARKRARIANQRTQAARMLHEADALEKIEPLQEKRRAKGLPRGGVRKPKTPPRAHPEKEKAGEA